MVRFALPLARQSLYKTKHQQCVIGFRDEVLALLLTNPIHFALRSVVFSALRRSAGATFYALLAGRPFASSWPQIMAVSRADPATWRPPPLPASVPRDIAALVEDMLRITPSDRPDIKALLQRPVLRSADARPGPLPLRPLPGGGLGAAAGSARASVGSAAAMGGAGAASAGASQATVSLSSVSGRGSAAAASAGAPSAGAAADASVSATMSFPSPDMSFGALGAALFGGGGGGGASGSVMMGSLAPPASAAAAPAAGTAAANPAAVSAAVTAAMLSAIPTAAAPLAAALAAAAPSALPARPFSVSVSAADPAMLSRASSVDPPAALTSASISSAGAAAMPAPAVQAAVSPASVPAPVSAVTATAVGGAGGASAAAATASVAASSDGRIDIVSWAMWSLAKMDGYLYVWTTAAPPPAPGSAACAFWEGSPGWIVFQEGAGGPSVQYTDGSTAAQADGFKTKPWNRPPGQLAVTEVTNSQLRGALDARCARGTKVTACGPGGFVVEQEGDAKVAFLADGRMLRAHGSQAAPAIPGVGGAGAVPPPPVPSASTALSSAAASAAAAAAAALPAATMPAPRRLAMSSSGSTSSSSTSASASASASASTEPLPAALAIGARVVRGPSWKWQSQDGGAGKEGVVVEPSGVAASMDTNGWVWVRWDANGSVSCLSQRDEAGSVGRPIDGLLPLH